MQPVYAWSGSEPGAARLLLLCLLLRSSWLTVEGDRQVGAAGVLCIARADGQPWPCRSAWLVAFRCRSLLTGLRHRESAGCSRNEQ
jgi:hypothetical protein